MTADFSRLGARVRRGGHHALLAAPLTIVAMMAARKLRVEHTLGKTA